MHAPSKARALRAVLIVLSTSLLMCATAAQALAAAPAQPASAINAAGGRGTLSSVSLAGWTGNRRVAGYRLSAGQAIARASQSPRVQAWLESHPGLTAVAVPLGTRAKPSWQVTWFDGSTPEVGVTVVERGERIAQVWTGVQEQWAMARGYSQYTGEILGKWFLWVPLCLLFLLPFVDLRRPLRLLHLDLLALLGFSASFFVFSAGNIAVSVPLVYLPLGYLLVRMLVAGFLPSKQPGRLMPHISDRWLLLGIGLLVAGRAGLSLFDSTVLDVGAAGVAGAHVLLHGNHLYNGGLGQIILGGDTYGPVNYLAYAPFAALFNHDQPWIAGGSLTAHHPSAQLASIAFDLITLFGLILLGRRLRPGPAGRTLGLALGYAWVSYPFTAFVLQENTNDSLVAALLVLTLLALAKPAGRGAMLALAALAKFVPLVLVPLMATGEGPRRAKSWALFGGAFAVVSCLLVLPFVPLGSLHAFYQATIGSQLHRSSPFSLWGQHARLRPLRLLLEASTVGFGLALAFVPRVRDRAQVAALSAALVIAFEACLSYWYYPYIVWFAPLVLVAIFAPYRLGDRIIEAPEPDEIAVPELSVPTLEPVL